VGDQTSGTCPDSSGAIGLALNGEALMSTIKNQLSMRITFWLLFVSRQKVTKERLRKDFPILKQCPKIFLLKSFM
jgi:hypothetical protein